MERRNTILAYGINHYVDRINQVKETINMLENYRILMEITVMTHEHMATFDDLEHETVNDIVRQVLKQTDLEKLKEIWT